MMPSPTPEQLKQAEGRHSAVFEACKKLNEKGPFLCSEVSKMTGIETKHVSVSLRFLSKNDAVYIVHKYMHKKQGLTSLWGITGHPANQAFLDMLVENEIANKKEKTGRYIEEQITPYLRRVTPGSECVCLPGQTCSGVRSGFSTLELI